MSRHHVLRAALAVALVSPLACKDKPQAEQNPLWKQAPAPCSTDKDCAEGFICKNEKCAPGERTPEEQAALKKKEAEAAAKAAAAAKGPKPGEGSLTVRICPGFKNTMEAIGTITAKHQETGKEHYLHLAMVVPEMGWQSEFTFPSLPPGKYDVTATYGIQSRGRAEVVKLECDPKARPCRDGFVREFEVAAAQPGSTPEPAKADDSDAGRKLKPCDWVAE